MSIMGKTQTPKVNCTHMVSASDMLNQAGQDRVPNISGFEVHSSKGEPVGKVVDVFVDPDSLQPAFAQIELSGALGTGKKTVIIPSRCLIYKGNSSVSLIDEEDYMSESPGNATGNPALPTRNPFLSYASYLGIGRLLIWTAQTAGPMKVLWKWASRKHPIVKDLHECDFCLGFWILSGLALLQKQDITPQLGFPRVRIMGEVVTGLLSSLLLQLIRIGTTVRFSEVEVVEPSEKEDQRPPRERILQPVKE